MDISLRFSFKVGLYLQRINSLPTIWLDVTFRISESKAIVTNLGGFFCFPLRRESLPSKGSIESGEHAVPVKVKMNWKIVV